METKNDGNELFSNQFFIKNLKQFTSKGSDILMFIKKQDSNKKIIILFILFIVFILINYFFSNKVIISFIPFIFFIFIFYFFLTGLDLKHAAKIENIGYSISGEKYPLIYKYSDYLNIFNELNYLNYFNTNSFQRALFFTQSFLNIYDFIINKLQLNSNTPQTYDIVNNSVEFYKIVLNELMSIIINIPSYETYIDNINIPQGLLQNTELKIADLQNLFIIFQSQIQNFTNNLVNKSINSLSSFSYPDDLIVVPNPMVHKSYSPHFNLF